MDELIYSTLEETTEDNFNLKLDPLVMGRKQIETLHEIFEFVQILSKCEIWWESSEFLFAVFLLLLL